MRTEMSAAYPGWVWEAGKAEDDRVWGWHNASKRLVVIHSNGIVIVLFKVGNGESKDTHYKDVMELRMHPFFIRDAVRIAVNDSLEVIDGKRQGGGKLLLLPNSKDTHESD